jgi:hypothetical protein
MMRADNPTTRQLDNPTARQAVKLTTRQLSSFASLPIVLLRSCQIRRGYGYK